MPRHGDAPVIVRRLPRSALFAGVSSIVSGSVVGQGLVILAYPVLTRLYDAADFGLLTVFTAVTGLLAVASTGALESAVPIPHAEEEAASVAWAALLWVAGTSAVAGLVLLVAVEPLADLLGAPRLVSTGWLIAPTVLVMGVVIVLSSWMVRAQRYGTLARRNAFQGLGQVGVQIGLGLAGVRPLGLLLGLGAGRLAAVGGLLAHDGLLRRTRPSVLALGRAVRRFRRFPQLALPSNLVNSAGLEVPLLLVSAFYGDARTGLLGVTVRVLGGPVTIVGQAVTQVFLGTSAAAIRASEGSLAGRVRGAMVRLFLLGLVPAGLLLAAGPWLFAFALGAEWVEAGHYAQLLAVAYLAQFTVTPVSSVLYLLERPGRELGWGVLRLALAAGGPAVCGALDAPIGWAIASLAVAQVVSYLVLCSLCLHAASVADRAATAGGST